MALVVEEKPKIVKVKLEDVTDTLYSYPKQEFIQIDPKLVPAISIRNDPKKIVNEDAVVFPMKADDIPNAIKKPQKLTEEEEKISFIRGRKDESSQLQEEFSFGQDDDEEEEEQSILIQKLREDVIRFEKLLTKFLDPDLPTSRKLKKKYYEERDLFRREGYKEFINTIDLKVDALCSFEKYNRDMFCQKLKKDKNKENVNWFKSKIKEALEGNFYSAQEIVNSVMQIVKEEEYMIPKRRIVTKLR